MSLNENQEEYWNNRYLQGNIPWDIGTASPPLTAFLQDKVEREHRILIPGAGRAHDAVWLWQNGFKNTHVVEIAREPLEEILRQQPDFPHEQLHHQDFFKHKGAYNLILEQTFFCALNPQQRPYYVRKMAELLAPGGALVGILFDFPLVSGPPYGGSAREYRTLFQKYFSILRLERCYNSIPPRAGQELFIHCIKRL